MTNPDLIVWRGYTPLGTFGEMKLPNGVVLYTVERPWLNNAPSVSCIPENIYKCRPTRYYGGNYDAIEITGVPNRDHILFHIANRVVELKGCVAPAAQLGVLGMEWAGLRSAEAFKELMRFFGGREFHVQFLAKTGQLAS